MKCANCFNCTGIMVLKSHAAKRSQGKGNFILGKAPDLEQLLGRIYVADETWVAAHEMPIFAQCSGCGWAPLPEEQPEAVRTVLEELVQLRQKAKKGKRANKPKKKMAKSKRRDGTPIS